MARITLDRIAHAYGSHPATENDYALKRLEYVWEQGMAYALLGPSGCGKTTALRMLAGFEHPDSGAVLVDGKDIVGIPAHKRDAGMVFQSYSLFPHLSAIDNVAFGLKMRKAATSTRRAKAAELLDLVGLSAHDTKFPHQMSGGQQQRVALARALALQPKVLLLDEPLSALDAKVRLQLREEIRRIQQDLGITTLIVTHDQEEALSMADRVAVMNAGKLEQCATPAELYARPATPFVAEFVGTMNRIAGMVTGSGTTVEVQKQEIPIDGNATPHTLVDVLLRPEAITPIPGSAGQVVSASFLGSVTRLTIKLSDGPEVKSDLATHEAAEYPVGSHVDIRLAQRPTLVEAKA